MAKNFDIEVREVFEKKYLKVFLKNISIIDEVQELLSNVSSVKNVNITESQSSNNPASGQTHEKINRVRPKHLKQMLIRPSGNLPFPFNAGILHIRRHIFFEH